MVCCLLKRGNSDLALSALLTQFSFFCIESSMMHEQMRLDLGFEA